MIHRLARDDYEGVVLGDHLPMPIGQFKRQAAVIIEEEQAKPNPDSALIEFACNAMRMEQCDPDTRAEMVREWADLIQLGSPPIKPGEQA